MLLLMLWMGRKSSCCAAPLVSALEGYCVWPTKARRVIRTTEATECLDTDGRSYLNYNTKGQYIRVYTL